VDGDLNCSMQPLVNSEERWVLLPRADKLLDDDYKKMARRRS